MKQNYSTNKMESINNILTHIGELKAELKTQYVDYELSKLPIYLDLLKTIVEYYQQIVNVCRQECNIDLFQKYHQIHVNLLTTVSQLEMQTNALLNKSISLIE